MIDEEMAEKYCNKLYAGKVKNEDYDEYGRLLYRSKEIKEAFLAGLEVGKEKVKEEEAELQQKWLEESFEKSKLVKENAELKEEIEKMRCCENCKYNSYWGNELHCNYGLKEALQEDKLVECREMDKWEIKEK